MMELAAVHRSQGKPAEAMALARSAMTAFKELHDAQGLVDAAEVAVYSMADGDDHTPIRDEALAVVDATGKPLACGVLHEWADELFSRGRGAEAFTRITEARECFQRVGQRDREARSLVSLGRVYRLHGRLGDALARYREALALHEWPGSTDPVGAVQAMNAIAVTLSMMGRYDEAGAQYEAALARARRTAPSSGPVLRRQPRRLQDRSRPVCRGAGAARRSHCRVAQYAAPGASPHPARAGARGTGPDRRSGGVVRSRRGAGGGPEHRRGDGRAPQPRPLPDRRRPLRRRRARSARPRRHDRRRPRPHRAQRRDAARLHRGAAGRVRRLHRSARPARRGRRGPRRRGTGPRPRLPRPPRRADGGHPAVDAGLDGRRPARRGAPAVDHPRLLGRPVGRLDLGGAAGSRAGAGPRAGPAVASHRAGAGDGGARRFRERGPRPADDGSCPARALARAGPAADRAGAPAPARPRRAAG